MGASAVVTLQPTGPIQQDARFMATVTVSNVAINQVEDITVVADSGGSLNSTWFHLYSAHDVTHYYVWYNINSAGVDPAVPGATGIPVAAATNANAATIATATSAAIDASADFSSTVVSGDIVDIVLSATGAATAPSNGTASPGFGYLVTTPGQDLGSASLATAQPQLFITSSPPQNPPVDYSSIDVYKGNLLQVAGVGKFNFDAICHSPGTYTVSAILYDSSGTRVPCTGASLVVLPVS